MLLKVILLCLVFQQVYSLLSIVNMIMRAYARNGVPFKEEKFLDNVPIENSYDFIVVGSGPGGSVMANRLTENPNWKVLLLEAGIEGNIYTDMPIINAFFTFTNYNWKYVAERQPYMCRGMVNGRCPWPSGKGLGGTTIWNGLMWTRCPASDFDEWESMGNTGWGYTDMLQAFLKVENMSIPELRDSPYHSTSGKVGVQYPFLSKVTSDFLKAGKDFGYDVVDYNDPRTPFGFSRTQITAVNGKRTNAATAYLLPIKKRPNLHVLKNAFVNKILIDKHTRAAVGVEFVKKGKVRRVAATKEVIVSAGAFNTPKLLMLSGIGPAEHLMSKGVEVTEDVPAVGQNLQEHISPLMVVLIDTPDSYTLRKMLPLLLPNFKQWLKFGTGPSTSNLGEAVGYVKTEPSLSKPNIEIIFTPTSITGDDGVITSRYVGLTEETYNLTFSPINHREAVSMSPMMMYPKSKGEVLLRSSNPNDPPVIIPNFLTEPEDIKTMVDAQKLIVELLQTNAMKRIGARLYSRPVFGCQDYPFMSDEYWECSVRQITLQYHHQCCTARMGPDPRDSVVDPRLRVYGVDGLRVVDASVMPKIPGAHTMSVTYAIAEKAAEMVKEDWVNRLR